MSRIIKQNQIPIITYAGGWKYPPTLEDLGYDPRTLIKKEVLKQQEQTREESRKQELHELNMQVLKAQLNPVSHRPTATSNTKFPEDLLRVLESNNGRKKASNETRRMAREFKKTTRVANYLLMRCIIPVLRNHGDGKHKFSKSDYMDNNKKKKYDNQIQERIKTLNKYWIPLGFKVTFGSRYCELIKQN